MSWGKLSRIIWVREGINLVCDKCGKHPARWSREQVIKGEVYMYHLCQYHKNYKIVGFKKWNKE